MYSSKRLKISTWRDSSHTWRAISSWNSQGASGKSNSVRPAASIAWNSPVMMPCSRERSVSSSKGRGRPSSPCSSRISRTCLPRITTKLSGRASLSTGINFCISGFAPSERLVRGAFAHPLDEAIDFFFGKSSEQARILRDGQRRVKLNFLVAELLMNLARIFLRRAATLEVEKIVDVLLEHLRLGEALGIALGQLAHPLRSHPYVRDFIGEDVVDRSFDDRIAHL